jgi:hypothetical protein
MASSTVMDSPSAAAPEESLLLLDSNIRDWVVLPLLVIMIAAGLLRQYIGVMLKTKRTVIHKHDVQGRGQLQRASRLRSGSGAYLTYAKWEARRRYFIEFLPTEITRMETEKEAEEKAKEEANEAEGVDAMAGFNPMGAMVDGVKGNMVFMVQNMVMMQGISHFFQGFVLLKVPFPLTNGFKQMFQRGLDLSTLDTSYVSSVSWYFLVMFGLRAFFKLAMGDMPQETQEGMTAQMNLGCSTNAPNPQAKFDPAKAMKQEAEALEMTQRRQFPSTIDDVEKRLLGKKYYPKKKRDIPATGDLYGLAELTAAKSIKGNSSSKKAR